MTKKIKVGIGGVEEAAKEFIDVWHQVEKGELPRSAIEKITFKDQRLLFKTLTSKRIEILRFVHEQDGISIRALASALDRDYSNVHQDVKILQRLGLMIKSKDEKYYVPWDVIVTEIPLVGMKKSKNKNRSTNHNPPRAVND